MAQTLNRMRQTLNRMAQTFHQMAQTHHRIRQTFHQRLLIFHGMSQASEQMNKTLERKEPPFSLQACLDAVQARLFSVQACLSAVQARLIFAQARRFAAKARLIFVQACLSAVKARLIFIQARLSAAKARLVSVQARLVPIQACLDAAQACLFLLPICMGRRWLPDFKSDSGTRRGSGEIMGRLEPRIEPLETPRLCFEPPMGRLRCSVSLLPAPPVPAERQRSSGGGEIQTPLASLPLGPSAAKSSVLGMGFFAALL